MSCENNRSAYATGSIINTHNGGRYERNCPELLISPGMSYFIPLRKYVNNSDIPQLLQLIKKKNVLSKNSYVPKVQKYSRMANGISTLKRSWASQTQNYTQSNTNNLYDTGNNILIYKRSSSTFFDNTNCLLESLDNVQQYEVPKTTMNYVAITTKIEQCGANVL